jgi:hypothetical protein
MAKKTAPEGDEVAPKKKKKKAKADEGAKKSSKKKAKTNGGDDSSDLVSLKKLAGEADISPQAARAKLRAADIKRPEGSRWGWAPGSKDLKKVRDVLGL